MLLPRLRPPPLSFGMEQATLYYRPIPPTRSGPPHPPVRSRRQRPLPPLWPPRWISRLSRVPWSSAWRFLLPHLYHMTRRRRRRRLTAETATATIIRRRRRVIQRTTLLCPLVVDDDRAPGYATLWVAASGVNQVPHTTSSPAGSRAARMTRRTRPACVRSGTVRSDSWRCWQRLHHRYRHHLLLLLRSIRSPQQPYHSVIIDDRRTTRGVIGHGLAPCMPVPTRSWPRSPIPSMRFDHETASSSSSSSSGVVVHKIYAFPFPFATLVITTTLTTTRAAKGNARRSGPRKNTSYRSVQSSGPGGPLRISASLILSTTTTHEVCPLKLKIVLCCSSRHNAGHAAPPLWRRGRSGRPWPHTTPPAKNCSSRSSSWRNV
jgi:hypothetical protein